MKRNFTKILAAFALLVGLTIPMGMWGQSDYSSDYTGNVSLSATGGSNASACTISINSNNYSGIKAGTGSKVGAVKVTIPSNTKYLHMHLAGWNGESVTLSVTPNNYSQSISLTSNSGISGNSPFTWGTTSNDKTPNSADHYKVITFSNALSQDVELTFTASSGKRFVIWGVTAEEEGSSSLIDSDLALTNAPVALSFDLYNNSNAQVVNYTTSSTGAVTVNAGSFVTTSVNENTKTITVIPVAVTNGPQTITVNQAADATYAAGSVSFTVEIADSTPISSGDVTFDAEVDKGTSPLVKGGVTFACNNGLLNNGSEYRLYKNSVTTFSVLQGTITQIVFTGVSGNPASGFATQTGWTTEGNNGTWTGNAQEVSFTASGAQVRATVIVVTVDAGGTPTPSFTITNNNVIAYDATSGSFNFTVNNPIEGGATTITEDVDWISNAAISGNSVTFNTTVNDAAASREGVITLTYTFNRETITENVTVSQAGNPNTPVNISSINAAGNYVVQGTIVAISNRGFVLGDGTGYIYYYKGNGFNTSDYSIGDKVKLSGAVTASTQYKVFQFGSETEITAVTESNYVAENPTTITGAQMDAIVSSSNTTVTLSNYVQYEGILSVSTNNNNTYYNITNISGATTAKGSISYPTNTDFASLDGKTVKVTGYFVGVSSSQYYNTMIGSIEEIVIPVIIANDKTLDYDATEGEIEYSITNGTGPVSAEVTGGDWLTMGTITATTVPFTCSVNDGNTDRTVTITLSYTGATDKVITVTQGHFVADYATLPFEFDGGRADIANTAGLTQEHLGTDYTSSPKLKFNNDNNTISSLVLKINETPGTLSFDIKGNSFSGGTFKVQTSVDGETYTDLKTYTELGDKQSEVFNNLAADVRYIKWVYTEKSSGNVALGNIALAKPLTLTVNGYGTSTDGGYVLVASPVSTTPAAAGMITTNSNYDLYYFDNTQNVEWINYKNEDGSVNSSFGDLTPGTGYLYANSANVTLTFTGTPYAGNGQVGVVAGYNLVGNPYTVAANLDVPFYRLDSDGASLKAEVETTTSVNVMEGVFVNATAAGNVTFSTNTPGKGQNIALNVMKNRGNLIDRAIVRFDEGQQLPKFQLFENSTKLYIPQGNKDFAIVRSAAEGEMPVNFRASENGTYTLSIETENVEMNYLHLIDNMTGADVDLLATPNYTFEARTNDYSSRFRLVFSAEENGASTDSATFAYFNGTSWTVSNTGDATLQVVDITGRIVSSETINGNATVSLNQPAGIYMLRLVNGNDVKVQKVVVR